MAFQVGDMAMLKSGGPKMTVRERFLNPTTNRMMVLCKWFNKESKAEQEEFYEEELSKIDPNLPPISIA